ncbi:MAG: FkbM family methyltransferase [Hyphomicrobiaceae bacterium]|nr:FkbM family methyltransferase [Hyphomicrobiaceae bacterium]
MQLFAKSVFEGDTIIDVGAHAGQYAILLAALCGKSGQVIAFEPDPHARELLERNLALNPTIKRPVVESYAVSDSSGEAVLFSRRGDSQSSLVKAGVKQAPSALETIRVSLVTLDSYLSQNGLPAPRWLKIDAEGAEIRILRGAGEVLRGATKIVCELHPYAWSEFGNTLAELKELASQSGRKIRYLDQNSEIVNEARYGAVILEKK